MRHLTAPAPPAAGDPGERGEGVDLDVSFERDAMPLLDQLYGAALRFTRDRADAGELVLETYVQAVNAFGSFEPGVGLRVWLYRILVEGHRERCRRRERWVGRPWTGDLTGRQLARAAPTSSTQLRSAEAQALGRLSDGAVKAALEELPQDLRIALYLADVEGFAYSEIAYIVDAPIGAVISRLDRGRRHMRELLRHAAGFSPVESPASPARTVK
jgi:RNA polymerase sigma-70 factor (ECF subfamily)